ncbi:MAG TPA: MerR family transcriptional regulator [Thermodesulfobacteriaceae bacterium]|nr:MerR family transcriptional regulator [Thermodesulfobacteriaceae bacterium]
MPRKGKKYYRIGEVSRLTGIEPHVLRYWEGEFRQIRPHRVARQRLYRHEDVEIIKRIKVLLHEEGYTIAGARKFLQGKGRTCPSGQEQSFGVSQAGGRSQKLLHEIRQELVSIKELLTPCR